MWPDNKLQNITTMSCCRYITCSKHIQVGNPRVSLSRPRWAPNVPVNVHNFTVCETFLVAFPHRVASTISWLSETALICEEYWPPVLMMLRSEKWSSGKPSGSRTIIMEVTPYRLVWQVNFCSTAEVNFQRFSCTQVIATRIHDKKTVLHWGCHPWTTLPCRLVHSPVSL